MSMGLIASSALIIYTVTLGAEAEPYALARRIGVAFYFAFTAFAHLMLLNHLDKIDTYRLGIVIPQNRLAISCVVLIATAITSAVIGYFFDAFWDRWENAYEWFFALLMTSMFYQVGDMWRKTQYTLFFTTNSSHSN